MHLQWKITDFQKIIDFHVENQFTKTTVLNLYNYWESDLIDTVGLIISQTSVSYSIMGFSIPCFNSVHTRNETKTLFENFYIKSFPTVIFFIKK